jgi:hypothetical protein
MEPSICRSPRPTLSTHGSSTPTEATPPTTMMAHLHSSNISQLIKRARWVSNSWPYQGSHPLFLAHFGLLTMWQSCRLYMGAHFCTTKDSSTSTRLGFSATRSPYLLTTLNCRFTATHYNSGRSYSLKSLILITALWSLASNSWAPQTFLTETVSQYPSSLTALLSTHRLQRMPKPTLPMW